MNRHTLKNLSVISALFLFVAADVAPQGCFQTFKAGVKAVTTTFQNPVTATNIYQIDNVYAATLQLVIDYRDYCRSQPYVTLIQNPAAKAVCGNRRAVVRAINLKGPKASKALEAAANFVANNPTLNASTILAAAWAAVTDFQNVVPHVK